MIFSFYSSLYGICNVQSLWIYARDFVAISNQMTLTELLLFCTIVEHRIKCNNWIVVGLSNGSLRQKVMVSRDFLFRDYPKKKKTNNETTKDSNQSNESLKHSLNLQLSFYAFMFAHVVLWNIELIVKKNISGIFRYFVVWSLIQIKYLLC